MCVQGSTLRTVQLPEAGTPACRATHHHNEVPQLGRSSFQSQVSIFQYCKMVSFSQLISKYPRIIFLFLIILSTLQRPRLVIGCFLANQPVRKYDVHSVKRNCQIISITLFFKHGHNTHPFLSAFQNLQVVQINMETDQMNLPRGNFLV